MKLLDQVLDFEPLPGPLKAWRAVVNEGQLLAFAKAVKQTGGRLVSLWGSDERDHNCDHNRDHSRQCGFPLHVAFAISEGLALLTLALSAEKPFERERTTP